MNVIFTLAHNTFREAIRDKLLVTVLAFGGGLVLASVALAPLTLGEEGRVIRDLGMASISLFSVLLIVMVGTQLVYREIDQRTIYSILTLPVRRAEFIVGKYLGLCATILCSIAALGAIYFFVVALFAGGVTPHLVLAVGLAFLEAMIVTAVALFFSTIASPLLSAVFTFFIFLAGNLSLELRNLAGESGNPALELAANVMYVVLPALHQFDVRNSLLSAQPVEPERLLFCLAYAVLFSGALVAITIVAFQRREFE